MNVRECKFYYFENKKRNKFFFKFKKYMNFDNVIIDCLKDSISHCIS